MCGLEWRFDGISSLSFVRVVIEDGRAELRVTIIRALPIDDLEKLSTGSQETTVVNRQALSQVKSSHRQLVEPDSIQSFCHTFLLSSTVSTSVSIDLYKIANKQSRKPAPMAFGMNEPWVALPS